MFIARDRHLTPQEEKLLEIFKLTYPTDQTKFQAYADVYAQSRLDSDMARSRIMKLSLCRDALFRIAHASGKTRLGELHDLDWCKHLAETTLNKINDKE